MIYTERFVFNPIQVNTYLVWNNQKSCCIIDPGCVTPAEQQALSAFIKTHNLTPKFFINTHPHIDHVAGNAFVKNTFNIPLLMHKAGMSIYDHTPEYAAIFGFENVGVVTPDRFVEEGETIALDTDLFHVLYTPGHADGSICLYHAESQQVFVGDVLFLMSVGRYDLPTGDPYILVNSIQEKLFALPNETTVLCGHGENTSIGFEKENNPVVAQLQ